MPIKLDAVDRRILEELQLDGRLSSQSLAERVGLSTTPCWRRVRRLQESGVIRGTVSLVDAEQVGLEVTAMAMVTLEDHHPDSVEEFTRVVNERPEILECHATSGQHDYTLKVVCESIIAYDQLLSRWIMPCKAVHTVNTSFVLRSIKNTTALPMHGGDGRRP
jgi:Lrp/AsnC family leucine-responsive transcriptional regulator